TCACQLSPISVQEAPAFIDIALMIRIRLTRLVVQGWQEAGAAPPGAGRRCCQGAGGSRACRPQHGLIALTICPLISSCSMQLVGSWRGCLGPNFPRLFSWPWGVAAPSDLAALGPIRGVC